MGKHIYPELADAEWLREQYETLGRSQDEIAAALGCAKSTVAFALRRRGIVSRSATARPVVTIGERFGKLVVVEQVSGPGDWRWYRCVCDCGNSTVSSSNRLRRGQRACSPACGLTRHGHTIGGPSKTYSSWIAMWRRCTVPHYKMWEYYGGRGIVVCDRWKLFDNFLADMGERPEGLTLDRIDPDGNYELGNCRWATRKEQVDNRRISRGGDVNG
jgi:hypothetical protein